MSTLRLEDLAGEAPPHSPPKTRQVGTTTTSLSKVVRAKIITTADLVILAELMPNNKTSSMMCRPQTDLAAEVKLKEAAEVMGHQMQVCHQWAVLVHQDRQDQSRKTYLRQIQAPKCLVTILSSLWKARGVDLLKLMRSKLKK